MIKDNCEPNVLKAFKKLGYLPGYGQGPSDYNNEERKQTNWIEAGGGLYYGEIDIEERKDGRGIYLKGGGIEAGWWKQDAWHGQMLYIGFNGEILRGRAKDN